MNGLKAAVVLTGALTLSACEGGYSGSSDQGGYGPPGYYGTPGYGAPPGYAPYGYEPGYAAPPFVVVPGGGEHFREREHEHERHEHGEHDFHEGGRPINREPQGPRMGGDHRGPAPAAVARPPQPQRSSVPAQSHGRSDQR
jgi:hypothetical protein